MKPRVPAIRPFSASAPCRLRANAVAGKAGVEDHADQRRELDAVLRGEDRQVRVPGIEPGKRVRLEEIGLAVGVRAEVDAGRVAAFERLIGVERPRAGKQRLGVGGRRIDDEVLAQLLVVQRVDIGLGILAEQDLAHAEHARVIAVADDADGELATRQIVLDQRRLLVTLDHARRRRLKLCRSY